MTTNLITLAAALGYTATLDTQAGYAVTRVILDRPCAGSLVFNPVEHDGQAMVVLCYMIKHQQAVITRYWVSRPGEIVPHDGTPASLRAAIVEAAGRVCG
jgi:hypothetical protein